MPRKISAEHKLGAPMTPAMAGVLDLLVDGALSKEIAWCLDIKEVTVKAHILAAMHRSGTRNRVQLAVWWALSKVQN